MKRRFGMWMGILLILIVGVSVTKMTRDFVVSQGVAASSILNVADAANAGAMAGAGVSGSSVPETHMEIQMAAPEMETAGAADGVSDTEPGSTEEAAPPVISEDAVEEADEVTAESAMEVTAEIAEVTADKSEPEAGMTGGPGAAVPGVNTTVLAENGKDTLDDAAPFKAEPGAPAMESAAAYSEEGNPYDIRMSGKPEKANNEAIQETVKSPLDPLVETGVVTEADEEITVLTAEDFFNRFAAAEESTVKIWEKATLENMMAYNAAAEQERVLWDYELNLVYSEIRSRMSMEEAEELKHLELEWLKTRDQYAEKTAAKSSMKNVQKQDPVYTRALSEKTKERCYWLVAEYEELLNQEKMIGKKKK